MIYFKNSKHPTLNKKKVVLEIVSGILNIKEGAKYLEGIQLEVRDYNIDGMDEQDLIEDETGAKYYIQTL